MILTVEAPWKGLDKQSENHLLRKEEKSTKMKHILALHLLHGEYKVFETRVAMVFI